MKLEAHAVILAGGRGTRFWPRSRIRTPKQLLNIVGNETMIQQTVRRIAPLFPASRIWVVTQAEQAAGIRKQLARLPRSHLLIEPEGRNTAAAIALAAVHIRQEQGDALMAVVPADHVIRQEARYRAILKGALRAADRAGALVVLGIEARRAETGYGYIERGAAAGRFGGMRAFRVKRFTEKPAPEVARRYVASGRYYWNAGMFSGEFPRFSSNSLAGFPRPTKRYAAWKIRSARQAMTPGSRGRIEAWKIFPSTTRFSSRPAGPEAARMYPYFRRAWDGATSGLGQPLTNSKRKRPGRQFPRGRWYRSTRREIIFGRRKSWWRQSAFAIWCSSRRPTRSSFVRGGAHKT